MTICTIAFSLVSNAQFSQFRVTLDAGHGGKDSGATNGTMFEKTIALAVVLKVGKLLEHQKNVIVDYTRKTDVFIELVERGLIANRNKASIFVSIHCNAESKNVAEGTETYVMGLNKKDSNLAVVRKENGAIVNEDNFKSKIAQFDSELPDTVIGAKLLQETNIENSIQLAKRIENQFRILNRKKRGEQVKPAPFMVLHKAIMPRVLIELGFISHPIESLYLNSENGQNELANGIVNAILDYKNEFFGTDAEIDAFNKNPKSPPSDYSIPPPSTQVLASTKILVQPKKKNQDVLENENPTTTVAVSNNNPSVPAKTIEPEANTELKPVLTPDSNKLPENTLNKMLYKVQFFVSSTKHELNSPKFFDFRGVTEEIDGNLFKYSCYITDDLNESLYNLNKVQSSGFSTAFLIAIKEGKRISDQDLRSMILFNERRKHSIDPDFEAVPATVPATIAVPKDAEMIYKVQILATKTIIDNQIFFLKGLKDVEVTYENNLYKYLYGSSSDLNTSLEFLKQAKSKGYPEAFLLAFKQGVKVNLPDSIKLQ